MSLFALRIIESDGISFDINQIVLVSKNEKALRSFKDRLNQFRKDYFSVIEISCPVIIDNKMIVLAQEEADYNHSYINHIPESFDMDRLSKKAREDYNEMEFEIHDSPKKADIQNICFVEFGYKDYQQKLFIAKKINISLKNGDYYSNKEKYNALKEEISY